MFLFFLTLKNHRMNFWDIFLLSVGLSMDAFAVSVCKGLSLKKIRLKHGLVVGLWFGGFQALMPVVGYFLGSTFRSVITTFDHWIAFGLLFLIGANMIREAVSGNDGKTDSSLAFKPMLLLAVATSIDALAVGITFSFLDVNIVPAVTTIGVTTFALSVVGLLVGSAFGTRFKSKAEIAGGAVLILLGVKILLEHLGIVVF